MTAETKRALGYDERDRVWQSSFTGAKYRYVTGRWEVSFALVPDWHPVDVQTVYAYGGEHFVEVTDG